MSPGRLAVCRCVTWTASDQRGRGARLAALLVLAAAAAAQHQYANAGLAGMQRVASAVSVPMFTTFAPGDPTRLYIAERSLPLDSDDATASIRILNLTTGLIEATPFLTITGIDNVGEGGLLGLAFHPDYQNNGKFYVHVTANDSMSGTPFSSFIREYHRSESNPLVAEPTPTPILSFPQPQVNHNGGWIGFGPKDGYLYIMSGDGGNGFDQGPGHTEPGGNAQDLTDNLLGKVLRVDVNADDFPADPDRNYRIPVNLLVGDQVYPGNPFAPHEPGGVDPVGDNEIWAYGLRNPFRAGFDRATGDLWIGDVGQGAREEVDFQPGDSLGGENYGWRLREGSISTPDSVGGAKPPGNVDPIYDYQRIGTEGVDPDFTGNTVAGGVPYRGPDPTLQGLYFFADYVANRIWTLERPAGGGAPIVRFVSPQLAPDVGSPLQPVAISEDAVGNLYVTYLNGSVYRIKTDEFMPGDFNGDASIDGADLAIWSAGFGTAGGANRTSGDADEDGDVDGADFLVFQQNYGWSPLAAAAGGASAAVPEPRWAPLAAVALLSMLHGRASSKRPGR
ncbi:MAG: sugar dehydrogenase [Planctomycetota bacterium]|nr:MAG: sugar dehydrogenase [Planctomycetota bacterium]